MKHQMQNEGISGASGRLAGRSGRNLIAILVGAATLIQVCALGQVKITQIGGTNTGTHASGVALSPDESKLYVAAWEDENGSRVQVYSLPGLDLLQTITYGDYHTHNDVVVSADGCRIYTQNYYPATVSQVDLCTGNARTDLSTWQTWPGDIDITPDRSTVVVAVGRDGQSWDQDNDGLAFYDIRGGGFAALGFVSLPDEPVGHKLGFSADSQFVYVPTRARKSALPRLYEISVASREVTRWIEFDTTHLAGVVCAGNKVFVADYSNSKVWVVDRGAWTRTAFPLPAAPGTLAMHPDGKHLFVLFWDAASLAAIDSTTMSVVGSYTNLQSFPSDIEFGAGGTRMYVSHRSYTLGGVFVFDVAVPPTPSIRASQVEICWPSRTNLVYRVQYTTSLSTNGWVDLFTNIVGAAGQTCVQDPIQPDRPQRFYRVLVAN